MFNRKEKRLLAGICAVLMILSVLVCLCDVAAGEGLPEPEPTVYALEPTPAPAPTPTPEPLPEPAPAPEPVRIAQGEFTITAYCSCQKCCGYWATVRPLDENGEPIVYTSSGAVAKQGRTIAVDPEIFEYGTEVWFDGPWGVQCFMAEDCGSGVDGKHIDIYFNDHAEALRWGLRQREVWLEA